MPMTRLENKLSGSPIRAVLSFTGEDVGLVGPRIMVEGQDWNMLTIPQDQLADFLNDSVENNGGKWTIISPFASPALRK